MAFLAPNTISFAQFPFRLSDTPVDVYIKSMFDNEVIFFYREGDMVIEGKKEQKF
jgi:hypothetical protein